MATTTRRQRSDGARSHQAILAAAAELATTEGLEGLTLGRLATHIRMSKSGLYAHFGSKEELQLATIDTAAEVFRREITVPAAEAPAGVARLLAVTDLYLDYLERRVFPGGCFFATTAGELGGRPGRVGDRIRRLNAESLAAVVDELRTAQAVGELDGAVDPEQLGFEIDSLLLGAHTSFQLTGDPSVLRRARHAVATRLGRAD